MFTRMSISKRILVGYVIFFVILLGISGFVIIQNLSSLNNSKTLSVNNELNEHISEAMESFLDSRVGARIAMLKDSYPIEKYTDAVNLLDSSLNCINDAINIAKDGNLTQAEQQSRSAYSSVSKYKEQLISMHNLNLRKTEIKDVTLMEAGDNITNSLAAVTGFENARLRSEIGNGGINALSYFDNYINFNLNTEFSQVRTAALRFALADNTSVFASLMSMIDNLENSLNQTTATTAEQITTIETAIRDLNAYRDILTEYNSTILENEAYIKNFEAIADETKNILTQVNVGTRNELSGSVDKILSSSQISLIVVIIVMIIALIVNIGIAAIVVLSIQKQLHNAIEKLNEIAYNVVSSSEQLAEASNNLAEGGSRQAASIEETSATMNETSSMVQMTTTNTREATELARLAVDAAAEGVKKVDELSRFMDELRNSSNEINKIVSDITSLSSQTNILALNASVESVRAGEAGKSFSVVAEEVRNLSQQSSMAASNTEKIIKNNINLTHQAAENTKTVEDALQVISDDVRKVSQLLSEINTASDEQSSGIKQINMAMSEMERVTQSTASVSQESAAAAGDLQNQSHTLEQVIKEITVLVQG